MGNAAVNCGFSVQDLKPQAHATAWKSRAESPSGAVRSVPSSVTCAPALLQDPAFWQTVHESGTVQKQREREVREQEEVRKGLAYRAGRMQLAYSCDQNMPRAALTCFVVCFALFMQMNWTKKLVVDDPVMRSTFPHRNKPTQEDRFSHILHDEPMKKSLQRSYVPPPPLSMYAEMPWSGETTTKLPKIDSSTFLAPGKDFKSALSVPKRDVSKLGPGQYQSWTASIHDKVYSQY
eukprot:scaffold6773_cov20-Tisochrysis_lutea.AAC.1